MMENRREMMVEKEKMRAKVKMRANLNEIEKEMVKKEKFRYRGNEKMRQVKMNQVHTRSEELQEPKVLWSKGFLIYHS